MQTELAQRPPAPEKVELVKRVCEHIRENSTSKVTLGSLGERFGVSPYGLQKAFVEVMGVSPRKYLEECRVGLLKLRLARGEPVLHALRGTGYSSQSWLYQDSRMRLGMTPATYRRGGPGAVVSYATGDSPIGRLLVAATEHGICTVNVGARDSDLVAALRAEYPEARIVMHRGARRYLEGVKRHLRGQEARLPLDIRGTEFQLKVWSALRQIPLGETRSYSEVAAMIGEPRATRAVANACASNPVPLIVPCHRVVRSDGSIGGYRLGVKRKEEILSSERALARQTAKA